MSRGSFSRPRAKRSASSGRPTQEGVSAVLKKKLEHPDPHVRIHAAFGALAVRPAMMRVPGKPNAGSSIARIKFASPRRKCSG